MISGVSGWFIILKNVFKEYWLLALNLSSSFLAFLTSPLISYFYLADMSEVDCKLLISLLLRSSSYSVYFSFYCSSAFSNSIFFIFSLTANYYFVLSLIWSALFSNSEVILIIWASFSSARFFSSYSSLSLALDSIW